MRGIYYKHFVICRLFNKHKITSTYKFTTTIIIYKTMSKFFVVLRCANSTEEMRRGLKTYIALQKPSIRILGDK